jgi:hypothetical protein
MNGTEVFQNRELISLRRFQYKSVKTSNDKSKNYAELIAENN